MPIIELRSSNKKLLAIRATFFFLILFILISILGEALRSHGITDERFFTQDDNTLDTIYIGSCHLYNTLIPSVIDSAAGTTSYMIGCANMSSRVMYHYLCSALERQSPDRIVLDAFCFTIYDSYVNPDYILTCDRRNLADLPFMDRLKTVNDPGQSGFYLDLIYDLFDILTFHRNWNHFSSFAATRISEDHGWEEFHSDDPMMDQLDQPFAWEMQALKSEPLRSEDMYYLELIIHRIKEENIKGYFFSAPYEISQKEKNMLVTLKDIATANGIDFIDFTDADMISKVSLLRSNMADTRHVNGLGAKLLSNYFSKYLSENEIK